MHPNDTWLTRKQLAERLKVSPRTISAWVKKRGLPMHVLGPQLYRYLWSEVEQWIAKHDASYVPETSSRPTLRVIEGGKARATKG